MVKNCTLFGFSILLFLFAFCPHGFANPDWAYQYSGALDANINDVWFVNANLGFAVGDGATILKTTDGGVHWVKIDVSDIVQERFNSVCFVNEQVGFVVGRSATIIRTTDGGNTWTKLTVEGYWSKLYSVYFVDEMHGWATGANSMLLRTTDGGDTWETLSGVGGRSLWFINTTYGFLGTSSSLLVTTDAGDTWATSLDFGTSITEIENPRAVQFIDENIGWVAHKYKISKTTDGGKTWADLDLAVSKWWRSIHFLDAKNGVACGEAEYGDPNRVMLTTDGGETWTAEPTPTTKQLFSAWIEKTTEGELRAWAVGEKGELPNEPGVSYGIIVSTLPGEAPPVSSSSSSTATGSTSTSATSESSTPGSTAAGTSSSIASTVGSSTPGTPFSGGTLTLTLIVTVLLVSMRKKRARH